MKEINENNASEMLALYIDGELEPSLIPAFEEELANNSVLNTEYRELLAIREAVQKDVKKLVPPYETTATIFESLGISYSTSISSSTSVGMSVWQQVLMPLVASFSAAVITFGTFLGIDSFKDNNNKPEITKQEQVVENDVNNDLLNADNSEVNESSNNSESNNEILESNNIQEDNSNKVDNNADKKLNRISNTQNANSKVIASNKTIKANNIQNSDLSTDLAKNVEKPNIIIDIYKLFENDIIQNDIKFVENGIGIKFNYNYNNQRFEDFGSVIHTASVVLGGSTNQVRLGAEFNLSKYKLFSKTANTIGINLGSNLFSDINLLDSFERNLNFSLEAKHEFKTLFDYFYPMLIVGIGHDFNSTNQFYRIGAGGSLNIGSGWLVDGRLEYNSLINPQDIQGLNYNLNNRAQFIFNFKYRIY